MPVPEPTQPEIDAAFKVARAQINRLAGWYASMIPDDDVTLIVTQVLFAGAQVRAAATKS